MTVIDERIVGERIQADGFKGVIGFVGEIAGQTGTWVGVDWDDPKRGKHNGCVGGKQYFVARGDKTGSFIRPDAVDFGTDIIDEIVDKYVGGRINNAGGSSENADTRWELVKMDKISRQQSNIHTLKCIVLSSRAVSHIRETTSITQFGCCTELDLSDALIGRWIKLTKVLNLFPALQTLHLNRNRLESLEGIDLSSLQISAPIVQLSMSNCFLSEESANLLTQLFTKLEEIYLANNDLCTYTPAGDCANLRMIDLQGNTISSMMHISSLSHLPSLEWLNISNCGLDSVQFSLDASNVGFDKLNTLFLQHNPNLGKWSTIQELARLPSLNKLLLKGVPLAGSRGMDSREMIISKLPKLIDLDKSEITPMARRSAELLFLSRCGAFKAVEPEHRDTIERLEQIYGEVEFEVAKDSAIQSRKLKLAYRDRTIEKVLSLQLPIHKIVGMGSKLLDFDPSDTKWVELHRSDYPAERLKRTQDNLLRQFDLEDGDLIVFVDS
ncbi:CAP-Gly domain-containing protein [Ditylenchus destructor]|nr:CAP-Gly domain-containing protein [Ditylenchus destructor]